MDPAEHRFRPADPYVILGVSRDAELAEIQHERRKLLSQATKQETIQRIWMAYEILSDDNRRHEYDDHMKAYGDWWPLTVPDPFQDKKRISDQSLEPQRPVTLTQVESNSSASVQRSYAKSPKPTIEQEIEARNLRANEALRTGRLESYAFGAQDPVTAVSNFASTEQLGSCKAKSQGVFSSVPPTQLNLKILNPGTADISADIIAVHGLGAIPDVTWKESKSGVNWLSDPEMLPKVVPGARIMRFGYDSLWLGKEAIRTKLSTIANKLLLVLSKERTEAPERPLIFIGHCFGGLVIERALITAKLVESLYPGIFKSSVGVIFLGTPHRGTKAFLPQSALLAAIAAQSEMHQGMESEVLDAMRSDRGALLDVSDDFARLCAGAGFLITCFFEQRESSLGRVIGRDDIQHFIVDETSATIDGYPSYGLPLDHFKLNKFSSPEDGNYQDICGEINRFYQEAKRRVRAGTPSNLTLNSASTFHATLTDSSPSHMAPSRTRTLKRSVRNPLMPHHASSNNLRAASIRQDTDSRTVDMHRGKRSGPLSLDATINTEEEHLRKMAIKELKLEDGRKEAAMKEEELDKLYQERMRQEEYDRILGKEMSERRYLNRLRLNMSKYGIRDIEKILFADPLPSDHGLSAQEIKDKVRWFKNRVKAELVECGVPDGQIDEILNDTGETMVINGVRTTCTRMALKWLSTRTLKKYKVPYQIDENDPSTAIIKRWVPEYEQEFLWDHTRKLREGRKENPNHKQRWYRSELELDRKGSTESIRSAPGIVEIARMRKLSGTLSGDMYPVAPKGR